jgi:2-polyprenyl-3-methyl-5-hydroxy-6-metoxy-1,4-benzoquinol methylase
MPNCDARRSGALTTTEQWDDYWRRLELPFEIVKGTNPTTTAILDVFDRFLASDSRLSVLEVGGAPGGYLVHLWRRFGHDVCVLDNSPVGVEVSRRNFELLGVPGTVLEGDLFAPERSGLQFDAVVSLGLIEHFDDPLPVVAAHLAYLKPDGTLIIGCPNLRGINRAIFRRLSPSILDTTNQDAMDVERWPRFERALGLDVRFRAYVAGFQPSVFWRCESRSVLDRVLHTVLMLIGHFSNSAIGKLMSRWNSPRWSYYALGVYRKPH